MRKHGLEIFVAALALLFVDMLLWNTLAGIHPYLPHLGVGILLVFIVALFFFVRHGRAQKHKEVYAVKAFIQGMALVVMSLAVVVFVVLILNQTNLSKTIDLTKDKINSLTEQTDKFLVTLDKPVQIFCVPSPNPVDTYCENTQDLLNLYSRKSDKVINGGVLGLGDQELLRRVAPTGFSRLVLLATDNKSEVEGDITESKLTNALINLIKNKKVVYFLRGSGEPEILPGASGMSTTERSYGNVSTLLESRAYTIKTWNIKDGPLPAEAKLVVVGDTMSPYDASVNANLIEFVGRGGRVVALTNPFRDQGLEPLANALGVDLLQALLVLDVKTPIGEQLAKQNRVRPPVLISDFSPQSAITRTIAQAYGAESVIPVEGARPLGLKNDVTAFQNDPQKALVKKVLMRSFNALSIPITPSERHQIQPNQPFPRSFPAPQGQAEPWPLAVSVMVQRPVDQKFEGGLVLYGFSVAGTFAQNFPLLEELIPLAVAELYQDEEFVSIPPREFAPKQFNYALNPGAWLPFFAFLLPVITALAGLFVWLRRRAA